MNAAAVIADSLDGLRLNFALQAGILRLLSRQEHLNKINVFPVPDGDTGTNLALTVNAVLGSLRKWPDRHAGKTLTRVADAALDGARGNSGAILAQFFLGLCDRVGHLHQIDPAEFAAGIDGGAEYARESLSEPREGTILTVLTVFAHAVQRARRDGVHDFRAILRQGERSHRIAQQGDDQIAAVLRGPGGAGKRRPCELALGSVRAAYELRAGKRILNPRRFRAKPCTRRTSASAAPILSRGFNEPSGSWNTICARRRNTWRAARDIFNTSSPAKMTCPVAAGSSARIARASELLPLPLSPTMPRHCPRATEKDTPFTAATRRRPTRYVTRRLSTVSSGALMPSPCHPAPSRTLRGLGSPATAAPACDKSPAPARSADETHSL